ncbi:MAG: hypothetical protein ABFC56_02740 [Clostridiaceae bacterium]
MSRKLLIALLALALLFALFGCEDATPVLAGTPTPAATPTPLPDPFSAEITAEPLPTDALGSTIGGEDHYWQYLSFGALRIYEYDDGTFLDGICVNAYPLPLDGVVNIVYTTADGKICGIGTIHNTLGTTLLETGSNAIYAEINTDIDVTQMDFALVIKTPYAPVAASASPAP